MAKANDRKEKVTEEFVDQDVYRYGVEKRIFGENIRGEQVKEESA
jgi:hypothetical protein